MGNADGKFAINIGGSAVFSAIQQHGYADERFFVILIDDSAPNDDSGRVIRCGVYQWDVDLFLSNSIH